MDINEIQNFIEQNKDDENVKGFISGFYKPEKLNPFFDTPEGLKIIQPRMDQHYNKGLETWKQNNLKSLVDAEVKKQFPDQTPEQKRLKELEDQIEKQKNESLRVSLTNKMIEKLTEAKLPLKAAKYLIGSDEQSTLQNFNDFKELWDQEFDKRIDEEFKKNGRRKPGAPVDKSSPSKTMNSLIRGN